MNRGLVSFREAQGAIAQALRNIGWEVLEDPNIPVVRPDLIARSPGGKIVVIEIKLTERSASTTYADLAEVSAIGDVLKDAAGAPDVVPMLITNRNLSDDTYDMAKQFGVRVVRVSGDRYEIAKTAMEAVLQPWIT